MSLTCTMSTDDLSSSLHPRCRRRRPRRRSRRRRKRKRRRRRRFCHHSFVAPAVGCWNPIPSYISQYCCISCFVSCYLSQDGIERSSAQSKLSANAPEECVVRLFDKLRRQHFLVAILLYVNCLRRQYCLVATLLCIRRLRLQHILVVYVDRIRLRQCIQ